MLTSTKSLLREHSLSTDDLGLLLVYLHMLFQIILPDKSHVAIEADERQLFDDVKAIVSPEIGLVVELLRTTVALVWLLTSVLTHCPSRLKYENTLLIRSLSTVY